MLPRQEEKRRPGRGVGREGTRGIKRDGKKCEPSGRDAARRRRVTVLVRGAGRKGRAGRVTAAEMR